ncbi:C40 family peptidase [Streptomyces radiopugnans]|uniref:NlpC/P60 family protein n=1 Tax=Streptomyces radiopugnans TaxID=403935 RepID=A0A1H9EC28_9ACTN|nr:C40 family peptidase [Streptomyces radiopugnans]SEQ22783.1 NlpC/P60 family protein [Streptomyces radiopugnans]
MGAVSVGAAVCALVCAQFALLVAPAGAARAEPGGPGARGKGVVRTSPPPSAPEPGDGGRPGEAGQPDEEVGEGSAARLEELRKKIEKLHDRAESATEEYNAAGERAERQRREIVRLARAIVRTRGQLDDLTDRAGAMARAQYRGGGLPPSARLVLGGDPEDFLRDLGLLHKGDQAAKGLIAKLRTANEDLDEYADEATGRWAKLEADRKRKARAKKDVEAELAKAEKLESRLEADELKRLRELEDEAAWARQARWLESGVLEEIDQRASARGRKAVGYAMAQIGKDYEWGAEGPGTFDCSGLTLRAWEAAGLRIPRTSQEQWRLLPRVDITDMRPGDLIVYKRDASHVGMYVGDGVMVHAPRTGRQITTAGAGSLPILGVVRPDA